MNLTPSSSSHLNISLLLSTRIRRRRKIVSRSELAGVQREILEVLLGRIPDTGTKLMWRVGRGERSDRPRRHAAYVSVLFDYDNTSAEYGGFARCRQTCPTRPDYNYVDLKR